VREANPVFILAVARRIELEIFFSFNTEAIQDYLNTEKTGVLQLY